MLPPDPIGHILNEHQRRHFEVLLGQLEDAIATIAQLVEPAPSMTAALTRDQDDLPPGFARAIRPQLHELRAAVALLARDLALQHRSRSRASAVRSILIAELVRLEDSTSKGLRGYGSVDPRVEHLIDPRLQALHNLLAAMLARLAHSPVRSAPTPPEDP